MGGANFNGFRMLEMRDERFLSVGRERLGVKRGWVAFRVWWL